MTKRELLQAAGWASLVMAVTCVPYLIVSLATPRGHVFPWVLYNSDDHNVYFAWMRQARDGHLLFRNLYTTDPQRGVYLHVYFLGLGLVSRWTGLDLPLTEHLGRLVFGVTALVLVYRLGALLTPDRFTRWCIFWITALSGGFGWVWWTDRVVHSYPVDVWQPEALTFPCLYTNGLFCASIALMLGVVICLLLAEARGWPWAVGAGLCGLVLGNTHSYDMIHLAVAWTCYLLARWFVSRRFPGREVGMALLAAVIAAPSVLYMYWLYRTEPIFQARADTPTWTPKPWLYLAGFGLLIPLALYGLAALRRRPDPAPSAVLLPAWILGCSILIYLPFAFQRKMAMGLHLPLSILAAFAVADLARRAEQRWGPRIPFTTMGRGTAAAALLITLMSLTSPRWLWRDMKVALDEGLTSTQAHPAFWPESEIRAIEWFGRNSRPEAALVRFPFRAIMVPWISGRAVYAGHWGETPRWQDRVRELLRGFFGGWTSAERREFMQVNRITHVLIGPTERQVEADYAARRPGFRPVEEEPFLKLVHTEADADPTTDDQVTLYELR